MAYKLRIYILFVMSVCSLATSAVTKGNFDFVVGVDGDFKAAKAAAESSSKSRFIMFFPDGSYDIGSLTGDDNQMSTFKKGNVSFIGQSMDGVTIYNKAVNEGISISATLYLQSSASNVYLQDITFENKATYVASASANRFVVIMDRGNKNVYKNVRMLSTQDTYYTPSGDNRSYLEDCEIHGTVDFICGGGDLMFNKCLLYLENRSNNCVTAPAGTGQWGYVFLDCTIDGYSVNNNSYRLGRSWNNSPRSVFVNTSMKVLPSAAGWGEPMNVVPSLFAEYNSRDANGNLVNTSGRKSSYTKNGTTVYVNPVLSASDAAKYTVANVMGGSDGWCPDNSTRQVAAPYISVSQNLISWDDDDLALCYVIFRNGKYVANTTATSYAVPLGANPSDEYTVRAANEMGGLGPMSNVVNPSVVSENSEVSLFYYNNGTLSSSLDNENDNMWTCSDNGKTDYVWAITGRDDKSILPGNPITYNGSAYTTFKSSNGAQNTLYLPKNVRPKKVTFIGYSNTSESVGYLTEVNGNAISLPVSTNTGMDNYAQNPTQISYVFTEDVCGQFTFTFTNKQVCFVMNLEVEETECGSVDLENVSSDVRNQEAPTYDLSGNRVVKMETGKVYVRDGTRFVLINK